MKAMLLKSISSFEKNEEPLKLEEINIPKPDKNEILLKVTACGVCHTELDEIEGRTPPPVFPIIPGHQVIGTIEDPNGSSLKKGARVGIAWIYSSCGKCKYCLSGRENLCSSFLATGRDRNGGYAEYMVAHKDYVYEVASSLNDEQVAPLLCAGAVGFRSLVLANLKNGQIIGFTGFGASAHLVLQTARFLYPDSPIFVFARNPEERSFALHLGAAWAGDTKDEPPQPADAIIDTTPVWTPVVEALKHLSPGGRLVINAIRKEDHDKDILKSINYSTHLWLEKEIKSVANVTRNDIKEFLKLASQIPIIPEIEIDSLPDANKALIEIKNKRIKGAKVLKIA